jgi:asparagine synthase (glutamine-hydrolysing)
VCGIAGFWYLPGGRSSHADPQGLLEGMAAAIYRRGPDAFGSWFDAAHGVGFAHRRLAIIDLSNNAAQPMVSHRGRYTITFNGEVYNFLDLRSRLEALGHVFVGHSDTEVMLAAIEQWGLTDALERFIGMYAFALWDRDESTLHLVRDRIGKKPLYYTLQRGVLGFASELKAMRRHPSLHFDLDPVALAMMLRVGYVPSPRSIFQGVLKVPAGHIVTISAADSGEPRVVKRRYWSPPQTTGRVDRGAIRVQFQDAVADLDRLLRDAVALRMIADVPLGAFLSGGIDSSAVVALMQAQSSQPIRTFTIGFREDAFNEAEYARAVAAHLGTDHTEVVLDSATARSVIPEIPELFDEPFADASQIPTYLVCRLARRSVTVALSGDGGDELYCGYRRYATWRALWRRIGVLPRAVRGPVGRALAGGHRGLDLGWLGAVISCIPFGHASMSRRRQVKRLGWVLAQGTQDALYEALLSQWHTPPVALQDGVVVPAAFDRQEADVAVDQYMDRMGAIDLEHYLPDDILVKVDRTSMGVSLEARAPLLDHRVIEAAARLPLCFRVSPDGRGKRILREIAYRYVPRTLLDRPKSGFGVPMDAWLRGPLRQWAEDLLSGSSLAACGHLQTAPIRAVWADHLAGRGDFGAQLWNVLMFQSWYFHGAGRGGAGSIPAR